MSRMSSPVDSNASRITAWIRGDDSRQSRPSVMRRAPASWQMGADGAAEIGDERIGEVAVGNAADVVFTEDAGVHAARMLTRLRPVGRGPLFHACATPSGRPPRAQSAPRPAGDRPSQRRSRGGSASGPRGRCVCRAVPIGATPVQRASARGGVDVACDQIGDRGAVVGAGCHEQVCVVCCGGRPGIEAAAVHGSFSP